jgi:hypothetical protein
MFWASAAQARIIKAATKAFGRATRPGETRRQIPTLIALLRTVFSVLT